MIDSDDLTTKVQPLLEKTQVFDKTTACDLNIAGGLFDKSVFAKFLTVAELAEVLGVAQDTVWKWRQNGTIPHRKFGLAVRFCLKDVLQAFQHGESK